MLRNEASDDGQFSIYRNLTILGLAMLISTGCNLCCPPYLDDYATVGGKWARSNPTEGRVGSVFSDPGIISPVSAEFPNYPQSDFPEDSVSSAGPFATDSGSGMISEESAEQPAPMILGEGW